MNVDKLKALNKPEYLMEELNIKVPVYGLPPEVMNNLLLMLAEIAKYQAPMQEQIAKLPTWGSWVKSIQPAIEEAMNGHTAAVGKCQQVLERDFQSGMDDLKAKLTAMLTGKLKGLEETLQARDTTPWKVRAKWIGIGASIPTMCWGLLWLLKIF